MGVASWWARARRARGSRGSKRQHTRCQGTNFLHRSTSEEEEETSPQVDETKYSETLWPEGTVHHTGGRTGWTPRE